MPHIALKNFRIVDETTDARGSVIIKDGIIKQVCLETDTTYDSADIVIDGGGLVLMPAFVDLHAHFRDSCSPDNLPSETLESACLAAARGGYGTAVCMANTAPVTDTIARAYSIKNRTDALGLVDVYPVLSLTKGMEGKELSETTLLKKDREKCLNESFVRLLSEDGKDVADDKLFIKAMTEARRIGIPVSCHCDLGGENNATKRALKLGKESLCRLHIAHVSTKEAAAMIREEKKVSKLLSCEVTPHHIALCMEDAAVLGADSNGRVNPPLAEKQDNLALIDAIKDGTIDAIATDHAPHTTSGKEKGAPGFTGLETAFAVCYSTLVLAQHINLSKLSSLMSAAPARILGLDGESAGNGGDSCGPGRGRIKPGLRADLAAADLSAHWIVDPAAFMSRGKNSPFINKKLNGRIVLTIHNGRIVFDRLNGKT